MLRYLPARPRCRLSALECLHPDFGRTEVVGRIGDPPSIWRELRVALVVSRMQERNGFRTIQRKYENIAPRLGVVLSKQNEPLVGRPVQWKLRRRGWQQQFA